jgi:hypothetical protein
VPSSVASLLPWGPASQRRSAAWRALGLVATTLFLAVPVVARAQTTPAAKPTIMVGDFELSPELEVRTRGEYRRNPVDMGGAGTGSYTEDPWAIMERSRVGLGAERGPLKAKVTIQDARVWGSTPPTAIFNNSAFGTTGLYEAFIEIHTTNTPTPQPNTSDSSIKQPQYIRVGRQTIVWDGGHLIGNADFSPVARTFDALRAHAGWRSLDFEAFAALTDVPQPIGIGFGDPNGSYFGGAQLYGALASATLDPLLKVQIYGLLRPAPGSSSSTFAPISTDFAQSRTFGDDWTMALGVSGDSKGWKYGVTGALQLGNVPLVTPTGPQTFQRLAYAAIGDASRTFDGVVLAPTIKIGASYASGGKSGTQYNQFDPLYPDVQTYHGLLGAFAWSNLIDVHGSVTIVPTTDMRIMAGYRYARLADKSGDWLDTYLVPVAPGGVATSEELGHEVDVLLSYRPWPAFVMSAGYSLLVLGQGAKDALTAEQRTSKNGTGTLVPPDLAHYAFLQLTLTVPAKP